MTIVITAVVTYRTIKKTTADSDWIIFSFASGCFCKTREYTQDRLLEQGKLQKRRLPVEEQNKGTGSESAICAWDVIREKANYPENVNKVPGLKCEGAACSYGLDIRRVDSLANSSCHFTYIVRFSFSYTFLRQEIELVR